jgi:hypothetical protein
VLLQKTLHGLSRRPHSHLYSSLRCNQSARLGGICPWTPVSHGWTHSSDTTRGHGQRRPTARRRGDPQLPTRPSGQLEPGLRPQHHSSLLWLIKPRAPERFAVASPGPHSMRLCVLLHSAKLTATGNNTLTIRTFLFSYPPRCRGY